MESAQIKDEENKSCVRNEEETNLHCAHPDLSAPSEFKRFCKHLFTREWIQQ